MELDDLERDSALAYLRAKLISAAPDPDTDCLDDEEQCFDKHPIHFGGWVDGDMQTAYVRVAPLLELMLDGVLEFFAAEEPSTVDGVPDQINDKQLATIVTVLRRRRIELSISQRALSAILGTTQSAISDWETLRVPPDLPSLRRWAGALGMWLSLRLHDLGGPVILPVPVGAEPERDAAQQAS